MSIILIEFIQLKLLIINKNVHNKRSGQSTAIKIIRYFFTVQATIIVESLGKKIIENTTLDKFGKISIRNR
ncbi:MAG: hypothetical protein ACOWWR_07420 [Eubacteriales bacterium]